MPRTGLCLPGRYGRAVGLLSLHVALLVAGWSPAGAQQAFGVGADTAGGLAIRGTADAATTNSTNDADALGSNQAGIATPKKPKPLKTGLKKLRNTAHPEQYPPPLPVLVPYPRAVRLKGGGDPGLDQPVVTPGPSVAALPILPRRTLRPEDDPYAPIGYGI
ncbi:MAG: hypothetical protein INR70_43415, partial [Parafilimonas terrae]|nr:hypothetical protein [Parafilimonas terrae]